LQKEKQSLGDERSRALIRPIGESSSHLAVFDQVELLTTCGNINLL